MTQNQKKKIKQFTRDRALDWHDSSKATYKARQQEQHKKKQTPSRNKSMYQEFYIQSSCLSNFKCARTLGTLYP